MKLPEEAKKIEIFPKFQRWMKKTNILQASFIILKIWKLLMHRLKQASPKATESQEAIDDFINQQKSANTDKKTATDMNTLYRYVEANRELKHGSF